MPFGEATGKDSTLIVHERGGFFPDGVPFLDGKERRSFFLPHRVRSSSAQAAILSSTKRLQQWLPGCYFT